MAEALDNRDMTAILRIFQRWTGATQCQLARACEIPQPSINEILRGKRRVMKLELFEQFADGLGIPRGRLGLADREVPEDALPGYESVADSLAEPPAGSRVARGRSLFTFASSVFPDKCVVCEHLLADHLFIANDSSSFLQRRNGIIVCPEVPCDCKATWSLGLPTVT